jgi:hypothetical protein
VNLRTNYHRDTGILSLSWAHRESERCAAWCSSHNTGWEMTPEQWLEVIGDLQREIDRVQLAEVRERVGDLNAELAAKIAEHGGAS